MRISDWISDVCSSDLSQGTPRLRATPCLACSNCGESPLRHTWRKDLSGQPSRKVFFSCPVAETWPSGVLSTISSRGSPRSRLSGKDTISPDGACFRKLSNRGTRSADPRLATTPQLASSTRSEEHTSELKSLMRISYAVFCLKKLKKKT